MKYSFLFSVLIFILFIVSCSKHDINKANKGTGIEVNKIDSVSNFIVTDTAKIKDTTTFWIGKYKFMESWKDINGITSSIIDYKIIITKDNKGTLVGNISVQGMQLNKNIKCSVKYSENELTLSNQHKEQISFKREKGNLLTYWSNLQPSLDENKVSGKVKFMKSGH